MSDLADPGRSRALTVVIHDVAPSTLTPCRALIDAVLRVADIPLTLLVVPNYHGEARDIAFERWLDGALARGHELALHGLTHRDDGLPNGWFDALRRHWYTAGEGEFSALGESQAAERLACGRRWFADHGWPLHGFVAPAWLMSPGTWRALADADFVYTATLSRLIALPSLAELRSQSVVYSTRAVWRRAASVLWNEAVAKAQREQPLLRLELHPPDVLHTAIFASWSRLLKEGLTDRHARTVAQATQLLARDFRKPAAASARQKA